MLENPLISIIIPVYNTDKYLRRCLNSVVCQSIENIQIIVINDGSTDTSLEIINEFAKEDPRIEVYSKNNSGLSSARNYGIRHALGKYVLHLDSDDWLEVDACRLLLENAKKSSADMVVCDVFFELPQGRNIRKEPYACFEDTQSFLYKYVFNSGLNSIWNKLINRFLYADYDIEHYEDISLGEDSSCMLRLLLHASKISYLNIPLYHYNLVSNGMSRGLKKRLVQYLDGINRVQEYYKCNGSDISLFPYIRLKICYSELANCSLRKATKLGLKDYSTVAMAFEKEIPSIKKNGFFKMLPLKYKAFVNIYKLYLSINRLLGIIQ